jgi:hypothetical protein
MNQMRSEGTPHPRRADGYPRWMRRSFRTRRLPLGKPGVPPRAGMRCPVGALRTYAQAPRPSNPSSYPCPTRLLPGLSDVPESTERCRFEIHGHAGSSAPFSSKMSASVVSVPPQRGGAYQPRVQPWEGGQ